MRALALLTLASVSVLAACGPKHHLADHTFANRSITLVYDEPPAPQLLTGWHEVKEIDDPMKAILHASGGIFNEIEGRRASARLDSASMHVDIANRLAHHTLDRASRYLGARAVSSSAEADYLLEVHMRRFGLDVRGQSAAYLFTEAEAVLLDRRTGMEIWSSAVRGTSRLTPLVGVQTGAGVITAGTLSTVSVQDFQVALDQLVGFSSNLITDQLRGALREVRRK